jgi:hypothetical protein
MARINISKNFEKQLDLAEKIYAYHEQLGDKSPIKDHFNMIGLNKANNEAKNHNEEKSKLEKLAENETELRNNIWPDNIKDVRNIAKFLKSINNDNPHELGKWGFEVDSSPQKTK